MKKTILIYNLLLVSIIIAAGAFASQQSNQTLLPLLFIPVALYFARQLQLAFQSPALSPANPSKTTSSLTKTRRQVKALDGKVIDPQEMSDKDIADLNRRLFLKLIGSAGLATFTFSLFTKRTHAAFFGSLPGPGTIAIKDSNDNVIDPAEKQPTDGYEICEIDDEAIPSFYGFMDKDGNWYIAREGNNGQYRYVRGTTDFATNWTNRTFLSYDYFNAVF